jgi:hypothetical protein
MVAMVLISLAFVGWCVWHLDWSTLWQSGARLGAGQWLVLSLGLWATYGIRAWRLQQEFEGRVALSLGAWLRISLIHNTLVNWLPFRAGEAAFPVMLKREAQVPLSDSLSSLFWLRFQDAVVLVGLSLLFWPGWSSTQRWVWGAGVLIGVWALPHVLRWAQAKSQGLAASATSASRWVAWRQALLSEHRHSLRIWGLTLLNWMLKLAVQCVLLSWLLDGNWTTAWLGAVGAEWAVFLPLQGWAGLGTYEAGAATAMRFEGLDWTLGLQLALVMHAWVLLNATLAGALAGLVTVRSSLRNDSSAS